MFMLFMLLCCKHNILTIKNVVGEPQMVKANLTKETLDAQQA